MKGKNMLDKLPAQVRHALIALAGSLLAWAVEAQKSWHLSAPVAAVVGTAITVAGLYLTPLTKQYGVSKDTQN